jgi:hypothetical protein
VRVFTRLAAGILAAFLILAPLSVPAAVGSLTLDWVDNSDNETGFIVQRAPGACAATSVFAEIARPTAGTIHYVDAGLTQGLTFCYRVLAFNSAGNSAPSNTAGSVVTLTVPLAPSNLRATP